MLIRNVVALLQMCDVYNDFCKCLLHADDATVDRLLSVDTAKKPAATSSGHCFHADLTSVIYVRCQLVQCDRVSITVLNDIIDLAANTSR